MLTVIAKMSSVTLLYVLLTVVLWRFTRDRSLKTGEKIVIGIVYGLCSVLSTHFGVDYGNVLLNVRDIGPLAAGMFFSPLSGILAGLIGGIERYYAGTVLGISAFTTLACSISTCLAGFMAAIWNVWIFKRKKPGVLYAFFMGAVMEVFHMYSVFLTHREEIGQALSVVQQCSIPMIVFTGLGMAASAAVLRMLAGEWRNPFRKVRMEDVPVALRFERWLFAVVTAVLLVNYASTFAMQTQTAVENARETVIDVTEDICATYARIADTQQRVEAHGERLARTTARTMSQALEAVGGPEAVDALYLEQMRSSYGLVAVSLLDGDGNEVLSAGEAPTYSALLADVLEGRAEYMAVRASETRIAGGARCMDCVLQVVVDSRQIRSELNLAGLSDALSGYHVGSEGTFDIILGPGVVTVGAHRASLLTESDRKIIDAATVGEFFTANLFEVESLCRIEALDGGAKLLVQLPTSEMYAVRDAQAYESGFGSILLLTAIYVLISLLVQEIVVNNLQLINQSLDRITSGDLDEVVSVRNASEFASLSDDINQTVTALKGYIEAAEKRIEQELEFAYTIQDAALPKNFKFPRNDFDLFATMDPAKEVGGDFYDFFFIGPNRLALVIADVSGKGIPAALFMMRAKTAIRGLAELGKDPAEILFQANNVLCEGNDAEMFVTVWLGLMDLESGLMRCANAGHEYPALMRADGEYELLKDRHGLALAAMEGMRFKDYDIQFQPGDRLFVYTDGIPEAIDAATEQYGTDRMLDALNADRQADMATLLPEIRRSISDFAGGAEQFDDITMLGFTYYGTIQGGEQVMKEMRFAAEVKSIPAITEFIDAQLEALDCPIRAQMQLDVAIDEVFANIASYAYGAQPGEATVRFEFDASDRMAHITFIDSGMPFNPLERPDPDVTLSAEERQIGGLGIFLVKKTVDNLTYAREGDKNVLRISKKI